MKKPVQHPRVVGDVIDYLHGLGFDHLYLSAPSSRAEAGGSPRTAAASGPRGGRSTPGDARTRDARVDPARTGAAPTGSSPGAAGQAASSHTGTVQTASEQSASASTAAPDAASLSAEERFARYDELKRQAESCRACRLAEGRRHVVFGSGKIGSDLMFIGEGPGAEEDRQGLPFVGAAGALLTRIIEAIDLRRDEVYIANMVKCRPPGNRDPEADEIAACRSYLEGQIDLVRPKLIVVLGRVAAQALLQTKAPLGRLREQWHQVRGVPARATYHPAALLRYEKYKRPTWEDMKAVRDRLRELRG